MRLVAQNQTQGTELAGGDAPDQGVRIRVLIAEDDPLIRDVMVAVLSSGPEFEIIAVTGDAQSAIDAAIASPPDLALLDVRMPGGGGAHAAQVISGSCTDTCIVAISAHEDQETIKEMVSAGASGYVTKDTPPEKLLDTLRRCAAGESIFTPASANSLMREYVKSSRRVEKAKRERSEREERLGQACEPQAINSVFQPIVDLTNGHPVMYEALTRFDTPYELNTQQWFEEAYELDMCGELELAALRGTVTAAKAQQNGNGASGSNGANGAITLSINASPATLLNPQFAVLLGTVPGDDVVIEVTEHAQIDDYEAIRNAIDELRVHGVRLAIDDAGAGFASLRHILNLMPAIVKLDLSLVRGIDTDQPRRALATGLISFANEIGAEIVAEGIETIGELETLRGLGVHLGQGYILARPAPLSEVVGHTYAIGTD